MNKLCFFENSTKISIGLKPFLFFNHLYKLSFFLLNKIFLLLNDIINFFSEITYFFLGINQRILLIANIIDLCIWTCFFNFLVQNFFSQFNNILIPLYHHHLTLQPLKINSLNGKPALLLNLQLKTVSLIQLPAINLQLLNLQENISFLINAWIDLLPQIDYLYLYLVVLTDLQVGRVEALVEQF